MNPCDHSISEAMEYRPVAAAGDRDDDDGGGGGGGSVFPAGDGAFVSARTRLESARTSRTPSERRFARTSRAAAAAAAADDDDGALALALPEGSNTVTRVCSVALATSSAFSSSRRAYVKFSNFKTVA
jgi:hypothetical protein